MPVLLLRSPCWRPLDAVLGPSSPPNAPPRLAVTIPGRSGPGRTLCGRSSLEARPPNAPPRFGVTIPGRGPRRRVLCGHRPCARHPPPAPRGLGVTIPIRSARRMRRICGPMGSFNGGRLSISGSWLSPSPSGFLVVRPHFLGSLPAERSTQVWRNHSQAERSGEHVVRPHFLRSLPAQHSTQVWLNHSRAGRWTGAAMQATS